jgi:periplasmic protein TonB
MLEPNPQAQPAVTVSQPGEGRRSFALLVSALVHGAALVALCWRPAIFVKPRLIARGEGGDATPVALPLYMPRHVEAAPVLPSLLSFPAPAAKAQKAKLRKRSNDLENEKQAGSVEAGARQGSAFDGPADGDEVKPALPLPGSFADPVVSRWELPGGAQGDVIVEITIDREGNVVEEKLLQGMGHGIDEKVIAALRDWRFRPATRNGVAIPSKHDVHFHFPS